MTDPTAATAGVNDREQTTAWLVIEWMALAGDLDRQADRMESFAASLRARAAYAREKAEEARCE